MNDNEILEGNKAIAEFMGGAYNKQNDDFMFVLGNCPTKHASCMWDAVALQYHSSWDWLMPVVEKIIEIDIKPAPNWEGYRVEIIPRGYVKITGFPMPPIFKNASIEGSLINATWLAVVEFIKWYNQNKQ